MMRTRHAAAIREGIRWGRWLAATYPRPLAVRTLCEGSGRDPLYRAARRTYARTQKEQSR